MSAFPWLTATPIAHRGLHDAAHGIVENTLSAAHAAVTRGLTIECDVQRTADGEAVVFHDFRLDRLTGRSGFVANETAAALATAGLGGTADTIVPLAEFLARIGGAVPVIVEVKSAFDGDMRLADRTAAIVGAAGGRIALQSFDPDIVAFLRAHPAFAGKAVPVGVVAEAHYERAHDAHLSAERRQELAEFLFFPRCRPDFLAYRAADLPRAAPFLCREALGIPVLGWTVRSPAERDHAKRWCDAIIFEGFDPA